MPIRVKGPNRPAPELPMMEEELPEVPLEEPLPEEPMPEEGPKISVGQVDPVVAGYRPPEMGPFQCANCNFFEENGTCVLVSGQIDPLGVCNLFTPLEGGEVPDEQGPLPEEVPEV